MRSGYYKKSLDKKYSYKYFVPTKLKDIDVNYDNKLVKLIEEVYKNLGEVNKLLSNLSLEKKDSIKESLIEEEVKFSTYLAYGGNLNELDLESDLMIEDIKNLYLAIKRSKGNMKNFPLSKRSIKEIHNDICSGRAYIKKYPGEFRYTPAWFGFKDSNISNAFIVFPSFDELMELLSELEEYIHYNDKLPDIIKVLLICYQFEVIHPFIDGNGRVGRVLFLILLNEYNLLDDLYIPISKVYHKHATMYYKYFEVVEKEGLYEEFLIFHLKCLNESLREVSNKLGLQNYA